jgi:hypothetical protein
LGEFEWLLSTRLPLPLLDATTTTAPSGRVAINNNTRVNNNKTIMKDEEFVEVILLPLPLLDATTTTIWRRDNCHMWWWTAEPRHAPCIQCMEFHSKSLDNQRANR